MHRDIKILLNSSPPSYQRPPLLSGQISDAQRYQNTTKQQSPILPKATPLIRTDFRCTEVSTYYKTVVPYLTKDHPSYQDRFQMHKDIKKLLNSSPPSYQRPPLLSGQISDAQRYQNTTKFPLQREATSLVRSLFSLQKGGDIIRGGLLQQTYHNYIA